MALCYCWRECRQTSQRQTAPSVDCLRATGRDCTFWNTCVSCSLASLWTKEMVVTNSLSHPSVQVLRYLLSQLIGHWLFSLLVPNPMPLCSGAIAIWVKPTSVPVWQVPFPKYQCRSLPHHVAEVWKFKSQQAWLG